MRFDVVTLFPEAFSAFAQSQIWKKALQNQLVEFYTHQLRDYADNKHHSVDSEPYGGGAGMLLQIEPLVHALEDIQEKPKRKVLLTSPKGKKFTQKVAEKWLEQDQLVFISGRYEGVDERISHWVDEEISIGDYTLSGGELPCMVMIEAVSRLIPGVVGNEASVALDSWTRGTLKYPQYTRPANFRGLEVPEVLRSGNHSKIESWRTEAAKEKTLLNRPELVDKFDKKCM